MDKPTYRVVLRARRDGVWEVYLFVGKQRLFCIPYRNYKAAEFFAAKLVDEMLVNSHDFTCDVQDEDGRSTEINLFKLGRRMKIRGA